MKKIAKTLLLTVIFSPAFGQIREFNRYFPDDNTDTIAKIKISAYFSESSRSNTFTNGFYSAFNNSEFLDNELKRSQLENLSGYALTGDIRSVGFDIFFGSKKNKAVNYYLGLEHQYFLDTYLDEDIVKSILMGNKQYAGMTIKAPDTRYYSIYFNRLKGGLGFSKYSGKTRHSLTGCVALTFGQNLKELGISNAEFYTDTTGEYINVSGHFYTNISDSTWAEWYEIKGVGASLDFEYDMDIPGVFHFDFAVKNLGFIVWNNGAFSSVKDTSFVFTGVEIDTSSNGDDNGFSFENLIFDYGNHKSFTTGIPVKLSISAGKYFSNNKGYFGLRTEVYPTLKALYNVELFAGYNINNSVSFTPVIGYGSYQNIHFGLFAGFSIGKKFNIQVGTPFLNSLFGENNLIGRGGLVRLTFINL